MDPFERRVEDALTGLPEPEDAASQRARRVALDSLPGSALRSRRRMPLLIAAGLAMALAGGGAVAAIGGALRDDAPPPRPQPVLEVIPGKVSAPQRGNGITALVDGKLWLATREGLTIEGLPASAAALSPHARFVVVGMGTSLVAMAPDGRRAWTLQTRGEVVAAAWAPAAILIAYVVKTSRGNELWLVEGNGDNPHPLVVDVAPVTPSWRPDSQAIAYVDRRGRAMVFDRMTNTIAPADPVRCFDRSVGEAVGVAYAPSGNVDARLAFITRTGDVAVSGPRARGGGCWGMLDVMRPTALGWISGSDLVVSTRPAPGVMAPNSYLNRYRALPGGTGVQELGNASVGAGAVMLDVAPAEGDRVVLTMAGDPRRYRKDFGARVMPPARLELWWVRVPPERGTVPKINPRGLLLRLEGAPARRAVSQGTANVAWR